MPDDHTQLYDEVCRHARRTALLGSISELLEWDERTKMPPADAEHRAEQLTLLAGMIHQRQTDRRYGEQLAELAEGPLATAPQDDAAPQADAAVNVRRLRREYDRKIKLPQSLVEELARTAVLGQQCWQQAHRNDDFATFRPLLEKTIYLKRQQAEALGYSECPYDALLDEFEPEERTETVAGVLASLREQLVPLVGEIRQSGRSGDVSILRRNFPAAAQEAFAREAAAEIGFDFDRGRLDVTVHPFCCGVGPNDCRITTRYDERFFNMAFFGVLHESGHGIYDQGLSAEQRGLPLGQAASYGVHESQSRMWENQVARSRAFWKHFYPRAQQRFPEALADVPADDFYAAVNDVRPSLIRVEADEATYNLHILVRFELERAMLSGDLAVADLPLAWNDKYRDYLEVTPPTDREGCLQDVHWSSGAIGYFPTYTLGNLYAAQLFARADADLGGLAEQFARGEFRPLRDWVGEKIHRQGQRFSGAELVRHVTGRPLSGEPLIEHLREKLGPLYGIDGGGGASPWVN